MYDDLRTIRTVLRLRTVLKSQTLGVTMKNRLVLAAAAMFLMASAYAASSQVVEKPLVGQTLDSFNQEAGTIRQQMLPGGIYGFIKPADKALVETRLGDMQKLLQAHASETDLTTQDKVQLVNAQEQVNGILRQNDSNRLVCESKAPVGSHIPVKTCKTYGEVEARRRADQKYMTDLQATPQLKKGN